MLFRRIKALPGNKIGKKTVFFNQLVICAVLNDAAFVENQNTVAMPDSRQAVRNHDACTAHGIQCFRNLFLRLIIQSTGTMSHSDELKRFENDVKANTELQKKLDQAIQRIKEQDQVYSDGELIVQAAKELGYDISITALEQVKAEAEQLAPDELEAVTGGVDNRYQRMCPENQGFRCILEYHGLFEDEHGHDANCWTVWHCHAVTLHMDSKDKDAACWSNYDCMIVHK